MIYDGISATIWGREKIKCGKFPLNHDLRMFIPCSELSIAQPGFILRFLRGCYNRRKVTSMSATSSFNIFGPYLLDFHLQFAGCFPCLKCPMDALQVDDHQTDHGVTVSWLTFAI